jgi:hypothetical protein
VPQHYRLFHALVDGLGAMTKVNRRVGVHSLAIRYVYRLLKKMLLMVRLLQLYPREESCGPIDIDRESENCVCGGGSWLEV